MIKNSNKQIVNETVASCVDNLIVSVEANQPSTLTIDQNKPKLEKSDSQQSILSKSEYVTFEQMNSAMYEMTDDLKNDFEQSQKEIVKQTIDTLTAKHDTLKSDLEEQINELKYDLENTKNDTGSEKQDINQESSNIDVDEIKEYCMNEIKTVQNSIINHCVGKEQFFSLKTFLIETTSSKCDDNIENLRTELTEKMDQIGNPNKQQKGANESGNMDRSDVENLIETAKYDMEMMVESKNDEMMEMINKINKNVETIEQKINNETSTEEYTDEQ